MDKLNPQQQEALELLCKQWQRRLVGYARVLLHNWDEAQDVTQETLMKLCNQPDEKIITILDNPGPWLFTVIRHGAIDRIRKRRPTTHLDNVAPPTSNIHTPEQQAAQNDQLVRLRGFIENLNEKQREVLQLKIHGELSYKEIAEITDMSISHVGVVLHEAMKALRQMADKNERAYQRQENDT